MVEREDIDNSPYYWNFETVEELFGTNVCGWINYPVVLLKITDRRDKTFLLTDAPSHWKSKQLLKKLLLKEKYITYARKKHGDLLDEYARYDAEYQAIIDEVRAMVITDENLPEVYNATNHRFMYELRAFGPKLAYKMMMMMQFMKMHCGFRCKPSATRDALKEWERRQ